MKNSRPSSTLLFIVIPANTGIYRNEWIHTLAGMTDDGGDDRENTVSPL